MLFMISCMLLSFAMGFMKRKITIGIESVFVIFVVVET